jgi:hypothetical protein
MKHCSFLKKKRTKNISSARLLDLDLFLKIDYAELFFLKKEPKTLALRGCFFGQCLMVVLQWCSF